MLLQFRLIFVSLCASSIVAGINAAGYRSGKSEAQPASAFIGCTKNGFQISSQAWICPSLKPMKPSRVLEQEKNFCAPTYGICTLPHLNKALTKWSKNKNGPPKGCYAFRYDAKKKAGGLGGSCHKNLYFDGVLCCPKIFKKSHATKNVNPKDKLLYKSTHFIHNLVK